MQIQIDVEKTTLLENKTQIKGKNDGRYDFKPKNAKKSLLISNEQGLESSVFYTLCVLKKKKKE